MGQPNFEDYVTFENENQGTFSGAVNQTAPGLVEAYRTPEQAVNAATQAIVWPDEIERFDALVETDDFVLECLPEPVYKYCEALCASLCVRPGLVGPLALGALATVFQRKYTVQGKEDWIQPLSLYLIVSAPPSAMKSPSLEKLLKPLRLWERDKRIEEAPVIASARSERRIKEQRRAALEKSAATAKNRDTGYTDELEAKSIAEELEKMGEQFETVLFTGDATEEALVALLDQQKGMLTLASDEGGFLANLKGRYKPPDLDAILQAYSGSEIRVHRIMRGATIIQNPRLSVVLCCQPSCLNEFLQNPLFSSRGATARFLYSQPQAYQGRKTVDGKPVPGFVTLAYQDFITGKMNNEKEGVIKLSPDAWRLFVEVVDDLENRPAPSELWDGWRGKYRGNLLRVAGILHAGSCERPLDESISETTMTAAVAIMDFFRAQFEALIQSIGASQTEQDARYILGRLEQMEQTEIKKRDLHQKCKGKISLKSADDMTAPLLELQRRGYIHIERVPTGGKPTEIVHINPAAFR